MNRLNPSPFRLIFALVCCVGLLAACSNRKSTQDQAKKENTEEAMADNGETPSDNNANTGGGKIKAPLPCDLKVSFYSIGSGINYKAKEEFDVFLKEWQKKTGYGVEHDLQPWGREGEVDYCISTQGMNDKTKKDFETVLREQIRDQKWVRLVEN